jgi:hypothetical protein
MGVETGQAGLFPFGSDSPEAYEGTHTDLFDTRKEVSTSSRSVSFDRESPGVAKLKNLLHLTAGSGEGYCCAYLTPVSGVPKLCAEKVGPGSNCCGRFKSHAKKSKAMVIFPAKLLLHLPSTKGKGGSTAFTDKFIKDEDVPDGFITVVNEDSTCHVGLSEPLALQQEQNRR